MDKRIFKSIFQTIPFVKLFNFLERLDFSQPNQVRVLTYHRIEDAQAFEQQIDFLARTCYVASMPEFIDACQGHSTLPPNSVLITFDDAYRNFGECAWPILKRHSLSASVFVPTAYPGNNESIFWWDKLEQAFYQTGRRDFLHTPVGRLPLDTSDQRIKAFKRLRKYVKTLPHLQTLACVDQICQELHYVFNHPMVLSWDDLRQLAGEGVTIGAHTQTHPLLNRISLQEARDQITGSLQDLQREIGVIHPVFAYPDGQFSREIVQIVKDAGFCLAFSTRRGRNDLEHADLYRIRRNNVGRRANALILRTRLLQASLIQTFSVPIKAPNINPRRREFT